MVAAGTVFANDSTGIIAGPGKISAFIQCMVAVHMPMVIMHTPITGTFGPMETEISTPIHLL